MLGRGSNGEVYRIDDETIIKVYKNSDALPEIQRERELARKAFILGIPTAIPYDVVRVGEGYGSVFELINSKSFSDLIINEPENIDKYISLSVDLLKKIHSVELKPGEMPDIQGCFENKMGICQDLSAMIVAMLRSQGISSRLMIGYADANYHAWTSTNIDGEELFYDPTAAMNAIAVPSEYSLERYY